MRIEKSVYGEILTAFTRAPVESGGILGRKDGAVCKFFFDGGGSAEEYRINTEVLNAVIAEWAKNGISFSGIIHSHPNGIKALSETDKEYAEKILLAYPHLQYVLFPVVAFPEGRPQIFCYRFDGGWHEEKFIEE